MSQDDLRQKTTRLAELLLSKQLHVTAAESCTGGLLAATFTELPGSSNWFEYGFVSYANRAKQELLSVPANILEQHGAVSEPVVTAMVDGALSASHADIGVAISGVAGPDGGTDEKPVGTVWFAWQIKNKPVQSQCCHFSGDRQQVRVQSVARAIDGLMTLLLEGS